MSVLWLLPVRIALRCYVILYRVILGDRKEKPEFVQIARAFADRRQSGPPRTTSFEPQFEKTRTLSFTRH